MIYRIVFRTVYTILKPKDVRDVAEVSTRDLAGPESRAWELGFMTYHPHKVVPPPPWCGVNVGLEAP